MAKFRYRMQNILNIKLKMENQARQDFAAAKLALDEEEEKLKALYLRKSGYEDEARRLLKGGLHVREIIENKEAILRMDDFINAQKQQVQAAETRLEQARKKLTEIMQERKTHETLREKAFEEFKSEEKRKESKEIDELTSYTYGQKAGEL